MPTIQEFYYDSSDGQHHLYAVKVIPDGAVRGILQISHGIVEHTGRYRTFMEWMADRGFLCVAEDHPGHGKTAENAGDRGKFWPEDGWNHAVADMVRLHDLTAADYPGVPYILFGHSMGSFLTRTYIADYPDRYDMVILSGTGHQRRALIGAGNFIAERTIRRNGYDSDGTQLCRLAMGSYQKRIKEPRTDFDWLSRDPDAVDRYIADEDCGYVARAGLYADMLKGIRYVTDPKTMRRMDRNKPVRFMSGSEDPVGDYGKGVIRACGAFIKAGLSDVTMILYPGGRHEMLNEINREEVYQDILEWIEARLPE